MCKSFTESHDQGTRHGVLEGFWIMRAQQLCRFAALKSQERSSGTIQDRQDNSQVNPWRWRPENVVLACVRDFKWLSSNEAVPS
eukprot:5620563-Pyramimonas_sp.AAC.1